MINDTTTRGKAVMQKLAGPYGRFVHVHTRFTSLAPPAAVLLEMYPYNFGSAGTGISADYLQIDNLQRNMGRSYEDIIDTQTGQKLDKATYEMYLKEELHRPVETAARKRKSVKCGPSQTNDFCSDPH